VSLFWGRSIESMPSYHTTLRSTLILSFHQRLGLTNGLFPSCLPAKTMYASVLSPIPATCLAYLILDLITSVISGEEYRSYNSLLCSFLHSPGTSPLLDPNILLSTIIWNIRLGSSSMSATKFHHHIKQQQNYSSVHLNIYTCIFG